ncbi:uncharacterized protein [Antedon mediterranea]|uniref:uncharacterized protein n=1 Tax=Antedon mediterranea TaxID=105859 RepID=UPI003AF4ECBF
MMNSSINVLPFWRRSRRFDPQLHTTTGMNLLKKKPVTGSFQADADPLSASTTNTVNPGDLVFMRTMEGNKNMGTFLCHVEYALDHERNNMEAIEMEAEKLKEKKKACERQVKEFRKRNGDLKKVLNEKKASLYATKTQIVKTLKNKDEEIKKVSNERNDLQKELEAVNAKMMEEFKNKDEEIKKVSSEKKDLQKDLKAVNAKMMEEIKNKNNEVKKVSGEKKDLQKELDAVNAKMMEELKDKDDEVKKASSEKKDLQEELERLKAVNARMIEEFKNKDEEIKKVSSEKKDLQKDLKAVNDKMMREFENKDEEIKKVSNKKKDLQKELKRLEALNAKMRGEFENKDEEIKRVSSEKKDLQKELKAVNDKMMKEFENKDEEIKKVSSEKNDLQKDLECLEAVNTNLNEKYCQQSKEKKEIEKLVEELKKKNEQLKKVLKKRTELLNSTNTKYESKYKEAKEQLNEAKQMLKSSQRKESSRKQGCLDCDQKERELDNLKKLLNNEENKVMELYDHVQRIQLPAQADSNQGKDKTEVLLSLLPTVNLINQKDLKPVDEKKTPVVIGQGAFGEVSLMRYSPTNSLVAVKTIINGSADNINLEARTMQLCSAHPSFPFMFGAVRDDDNTIHQLVSSFIGDQDSSSLTLRTAMQSKFANMNRWSILNILLTVSDGVKFLHQHDIVHNDIKAENILLSHESDEWMGKIIDMGGITSPLVEPPAAEVTSSDIFALCFVMCEVAQACHWQQLNELAVRCKKTRPPIDDLISLLSKLNI